MADYLTSYEEEQQLAAAIHAVLSEKATDISKIKTLRRMQMTASSPLGRSRIAYHLHQLLNGLLLRVGHIVGLLFVTSYCIFMTLRACIKFYPADNPLLPLRNALSSALVCCITVSGIAAAAVLLCQLLLHRMYKK